MIKSFAACLFAGTCLASTAIAAPDSACTGDPDATGMRTRMERMHEQMDKAQAAGDKAQQRRILDLHAKHMSEGARELRRRQAGLAPGCRLELMHSLMEQVIVHQQVAQDLGER